MPTDHWSGISDRLIEHFEYVVWVANHADDIAELRGMTGVVEALTELGVEPSDHTFKLLFKLRASQPCPLHLVLLRQLAREGTTPHLADDARLPEFLLDLSTFKEVFNRLNPSFFECESGASCREEAVWYAASLLDLALQRGLLQTAEINSMEELIKVSLDLTRHE